MISIFHWPTTMSWQTNIGRTLSSNDWTCWGLMYLCSLTSSSTVFLSWHIPCCGYSTPEGWQWYICGHCLGLQECKLYPSNQVTMFTGKHASLCFDRTLWLDKLYLVRHLCNLTGFWPVFVQCPDVIISSANVFIYFYIWLFSCVLWIRNLLRTVAPTAEPQC